MKVDEIKLYIYNISFSPCTVTQWRHKSKKYENFGWCGRQNMLRPYLEIWEWELIFCHAVKSISSPGIRSIQKSTRNSWTLNWPTSQNQPNRPKLPQNKPKPQILFKKKSQPQEFIKKTLPPYLLRIDWLLAVVVRVNNGQKNRKRATLVEVLLSRRTRINLRIWFGMIKVYR